MPTAPTAVLAARNSARVAMCDEGLLTANEASALMGISSRYVYRLIERGELKCVRIGGRVLVPRRAAVQFAADRVQAK